MSSEIPLAAREAGFTIAPKANNSAIPLAAREAGFTIAPTTTDKIANQPKSTLDKVTDLINSIGVGAAQNITDLGAGAIDLAHHLVNHLLPSQIISKIPSGEEDASSIINLLRGISTKILPSEITGGVQPKVKPTEITNYFAKKAPGSIAEQIGEFLDPLQYVIPVAKPLEAIEAGIKSIPTLARASEKFIPRLIGASLKGGVPGAIMGALYSPGQQQRGAEFGGGIGGGIGAILGTPGALVGSQIGRLRRLAYATPSVRRTPEEANKLLNIVGDELPLNLGDIVKSSTLSNFYHDTLSNLPFVGAKQKGEIVLNAANQHAQNIMNSLQHGVDEANIDDNLRNSVLKHYDFVRKHWGDKYNDLYKKVENAGIKGNANNTLDTIKELDKKFMPPKDFLSELEKEKLNTHFKKNKPISFKASRNLISIFGKRAHQAAMGADDVKASVYSSLKDAIKNDLANAVKESGHPELNNELSTINKGYKHYVAPYKESSIRKILFEGSTPQNIDNLLLKGKGLPIVDQFTPKEKDILASKNFIKTLDSGVGSDKATNPFKLTTKYSKGLSERQKEVLFGKRKIRQKFEKLSALTDMAAEPALAAKRPATGFRRIGQAVRETLPIGLTAAAIRPDIGVPILGGLGGALAGGRLAQKALTGPALREAYVTGELPKLLEMRGATNLLPRLSALITAQKLQRGQQ